MVHQRSKEWSYPPHTEKSISPKISGTIRKHGFKHVRETHLTLLERATGARQAVLRGLAQPQDHNRVYVYVLGGFGAVSIGKRWLWCCAGCAGWLMASCLSHNDKHPMPNK